MTREEWINPPDVDNPVIDKLLWLVRGDVDLMTEAIIACSRQVYERPHWYSMPWQKRHRWKVDLQEVTNWIIHRVRQEDERSSTS